MRLQCCIRAFLTVAFLVPPYLAAAQSSSVGAIAGAARDTTGGVLPGVTVEARSPALIAGVRTAVTDGQGRYNIIDLRPGTYAVTFTLPGFSVFRREGIEVVTGVTANVNGEMAVGGLEETVTVSGVSPVVDIQNVRSQTVLSQDVLDELPFARSTAAFAQLLLGVSVGTSSELDVGAVKEAGSSLRVHGSRRTDGRFKVDGLSFQNNSSNGGGRSKTYFANVVAMQETTIEIAGISAEADQGGVHINFVPKEGGNTFDFYGTGNFANGDLQSSNITADHLARGISVPGKIDRVYDAGVGVGGPIFRDRLWFYTAHRRWRAREFQPGVFFNKSTNFLFYEPDMSRPGFIDNRFRDHSVRLTWQATERHKLALNYSRQYNCYCFSRVNSTLAPEATFSLDFSPQYITAGSWSNPISNRLLADAAVAYYYQPKKTINNSLGPDAVGIEDSGLGIKYAAFASSSSVAYNVDPKGQLDRQMNGRASLSYVTGSHAMKVGFTFVRGWQKIDRTTQNHISYEFVNRVPIELTQWATPILTNNNFFGTTLYAQDQWTIDRLTLTGGLNFAVFRGWAPETSVAASRFRPAATFAAIEDSPNWRDISPRVGAAYDLFGNGRTALKVSVGRYLGSMGAGITNRINPQLSISPRATRSWDDSNDNFQPDCDLNSVLANAECGALSNSKFGTVVLTRQYDEDYINGFGKRAYNWQSSVAVQHELGPNVALNVGYFRTWFGNFEVTDNRSVTPADYDPFCVTLPTDSFLPGSGQEQCGLFDLNPAKLGQVDNFVTLAENFGEYSEVFNGVDAGVTARFNNGALVNGGISVGRTVLDTCAVIDSPQAARPGYCRVVAPFWDNGGQVKVAGVYPLPWWGVRVSGTYQNIATTQVLATNTYRDADVAASLGRNLATGSARIPIIPNETVFEDRFNQVDLRFTHIFSVGRSRFETSLDVYNLNNSGAILAINSTYGSRWRQPRLIIPPRVVKVGFTFSY